MKFPKQIFKKDTIRSSIPAGATSGAYGHVDECSERGIGGWALNLDRTVGSTRVTAYVNGQRIGGVHCCLPRPDIDTITGKCVACGFLLRWATCDIDDSILEGADDKECSLELRLDDLDRPITSKCKSIRVSELRRWAGTRGKTAFHPGSLLSPELSTILTPKGLAQHLDSIPGQTVLPKFGKEDVRLIAYYLPQFHPIPENDEWWGPGFTEWTNVSQARPCFTDHYQPHVPGELGFYDLRLGEAREAQARLAKEHGIYGFCYYYYWFAGRRLLERPLQEVLESGKPDFPFCICWANENWSRRWDGSEQEVLVEQLHNEQTDADFIHAVIPLFRDPRYIRVNDAPLLIIYRVSLMPEPAKTAERWREICAESGIPEIHLCMAETFGLTEPRQYGYNSSVQFPPHGVVAPEANSKVPGLIEGFSGKLYSYDDVVQDQLAREAPTYKRFPGVMTSWDNTPRKKKAGNAFLKATPEAYEVWLRGAIDQAKERLPAGEQLVFINAWNEWAEGAHLEPDRKHRRAYLEATRRALKGQTDWRVALEYANRLPELAGEAKIRFVADMRYSLERLSKVNQHLLAIMGANGLPKQWTVMKPGLPYGMVAKHMVESGEVRIDQLNHHSTPYQRRVGIDGAQKLYLYGWSFCRDLPLQKDTPSYLLLKDAARDSWHHSLIVERIERPDVMRHFSDVKPEFTRYAGIKIQVDISAVPAGCYQISVAYRTGKIPALAVFEGEIEIA